jgi:selenide,water dikinase
MAFLARELLLVGGGHSHALVLASFAGRREPRLRTTLVSADRFTTYSGMVPGVLGGQYPLRAAQIDLDALARRAGARFVAERAVRIDPARRRLELGGGSSLPYDVVSFDIGSLPLRTAVIDDDAPLIALKPIEPAVAALDAALAAPPPARGRRVVVVGAGAGGTEVAFALAARLRDEPHASVTVCDHAARPVTTRGERTAVLVERAFAEAGIRFIGAATIAHVTRTGVRLDDQRELEADIVVWATGAGAPALFAHSGLLVDGRGHLLVGDDLRSPAHADIFAAGDCATLTTHPDLPKAGVYAVRQGLVLADNLHATAREDQLRAFQPQARFLALLNTGDGRAILSYGRFACRGRWAWRLKDRIDRRFVARFAG